MSRLAEILAVVCVLVCAASVRAGEGQLAGDAVTVGQADSAGPDAIAKPLAGVAWRVYTTSAACSDDDSTGIADALRRRPTPGGMSRCATAGLDEVVWPEVLSHQDGGLSEAEMAELGATDPKGASLDLAEMSYWRGQPAQARPMGGIIVSRAPVRRRRHVLRRRRPAQTDIPRYEPKDRPNISGMDFRGASIIGVDLSGVDLTGASFATADVRDANFAGADIEGASFQHARGFTKTQLQSTRSWARRNLQGVNVDGDRGGRDLRGLDFGGMDLAGASFHNVDLRGASLRRAVIHEASFSGPHNLTKDQLRTTQSWHDKDLSGAEFLGLDFSGLDFSEFDLSGASFRGSDLRGADFSRANLRGVDFGEAKLAGAKFSDAILDGAGFGLAPRRQEEDEVAEGVGYRPRGGLGTVDESDLPGLLADAGERDTTVGLPRRHFLDIEIEGAGEGPSYNLSAEENRRGSGSASGNGAVAGVRSTTSGFGSAGFGSTQWAVGSGGGSSGGSSGGQRSSGNASPGRPESPGKPASTGPGQRPKLPLGHGVETVITRETTVTGTGAAGGLALAITSDDKLTMKILEQTYGRLVVEGDAFLAGTLEVVVEGRIMEQGMAFDLFDFQASVSGAFEHIMLPNEYLWTWDITELLDNGEILLTHLGGDWNGNGFVDVEDLDILTSHYGDGRYDLDGDGDCDEGDLIVAVEDLLALTDGSGRYGTKRGDYNVNGIVGEGDVGTLRKGFGDHSANWVGGDVNGDGYVDATDLAILKKNYGFDRSLVADVPEPITVCLLAVGGLALLRRRK
ncbi:MAG: pentapeptide repeat-containing protein [Planctomycetota bacterium]